MRTPASSVESPDTPEFSPPRRMSRASPKHYSKEAAPSFGRKRPRFSLNASPARPAAPAPLVGTHLPHHPNPENIFLRARLGISATPALLSGSIPNAIFR